MEGKLEAARKLIRETLDSDDIFFEYDVCGVSALKKLCAEDSHIKKLYSDDSNELTDADRERLHEESRFFDFQKLLSDLASEGKYKEIMNASAAGALHSLIDRMLPAVRERREIHLELREQDDKTKRIEKAQKIISRMEADKEGCRRKLENFIASRDAENKKGLKEHAENRLRDVYDKICEEIDERIRNYDDYEELKLTEGKSAADYYATRAARRINTDLIPHINESIRANLSHIYDEAAQQVMGYMMNFSGRQEKVEIKIQELQENVQMDENDHDAAIRQLQQKRGEKGLEMDWAREEAERARRELKETDSKIRREEQQKDSDEKSSRMEIESLGERPEAEERTVKKSRAVSRGGLFGGILDFFCSEKMEDYEDIEIDDSKQREWERMQKEYADRQRLQKEQKNRTGGSFVKIKRKS